MKLLGLSLGLLAGLFSSLVAGRDYRFSDAHLHYVDFFQESAGMPELLKQMAAANIEHVMLSGIPVAKIWDESEPKRPRYYAGDDAHAYWYSATDVLVARAYQQVSAEQRKRLHPFLSGFNPSDKNADAHIQRMLELDPGSSPAGITDKLIIDATTPVAPDNRGHYSQPVVDLPETKAWAEKLTAMLAARK